MVSKEAQGCEESTFRYNGGSDVIYGLFVSILIYSFYGLLLGVTVCKGVQWCVQECNGVLEIVIALSGGVGGVILCS